MFSISQTNDNYKYLSKWKDMIFNLCRHAVTVCSKVFVVICGEKKRHVHVNLHTTVIFI